MNKRLYFWVILLLLAVVYHFYGYKLVDNKPIEPLPAASDLPMTVPSMESSARGDGKVMLIKVDAAGECTVNGGAQALSMPDLRRQLSDYASKCKGEGSDPHLQIYASPDCDQQKVIDVLNTIRSAGVNTVTFTDSE